MRVYCFLFVIILHSATATVDLNKLKESLAENIETLEDNAARKLQSIQNIASQSFHQFIDTIDLEKLKKLDIFHILPKLQRKGEFIHKTVKSLPEYKQKALVYLQKAKSLSGQDLLMAFDTDVPWPAKRLDAIGI